MYHICLKYSDRQAHQVLHNMASDQGVHCLPATHPAILDTYDMYDQHVLK